MSTPPREHPDAGVITFTPRGEAALERLAASLARGCDGSPASIADILAQVLDADIEQLADTLDDAVEHPDRATPQVPGPGRNAQPNAQSNAQSHPEIGPERSAGDVTTHRREGHLGNRLMAGGPWWARRRKAVAWRQRSVVARCGARTGYPQPAPAAERRSALSAMLERQHRLSI